MIDYFKVGPLGKKKVPQFAVLYDYSKFGIKRLELYNSWEAFKNEKKDKKKISNHVINLECCSNVFMDEIREAKKTEFFITIQFNSDDRQETFSSGTIQEALVWFQRLRSISPDGKCKFEVEIKSNEMAEKMNLKGVYLLSISLVSIELLDRQTKKSVLEWRLHFIRRYCCDEQEFLFESGRRCSSGPGLFCFKTDHYSAICNEVKRNVKMNLFRVSPKK